MRRAARTDGNHAQIAEVLRKAGCSVLSLAPMGKGVPDLLIARRDIGNVLLEIKDGAKPPSRKRLTAPEQRFFDTWLGPLYIVESIDNTLDILGRA